MGEMGKWVNGKMVEMADEVEMAMRGHENIDK